jgi:subtilisin family serine protease
VEAVAVAAVDGSFVKTPWSQCGPEVVLSAPGVDLISTYDASSWSHWDGTSFATPMVSGATALLLQAHPELTSRDVKATLRSCTQPDANVSPIRELMGAGVLDLATIATVTPTLPGSLHVHEDAAGTEVEAEPVEGAGLYDVGRGLVSELRVSGGHVDLGTVTCLADDVPTPRVADPAHPPAGDAFFYVVRDDSFETESGAWGTYADGMERIASSGDCTF